MSSLVIQSQKQKQPDCAVACIDSRQTQRQRQIPSAVLGVLLLLLLLAIVGPLLGLPLPLPPIRRRLSPTPAQRSLTQSQSRPPPIAAAATGPDPRFRTRFRPRPLFPPHVCTTSRILPSSNIFLIWRPNCSQSQLFAHHVVESVGKAHEHHPPLCQLSRDRRQLAPNGSVWRQTINRSVFLTITFYPPNVAQFCAIASPEIDSYHVKHHPPSFTLCPRRLSSTVNAGVRLSNL